eukprot:evm.model.scf_818.8 EVM.evm.TU.scf_818.8   scf_818:48538-54200(+)
MGVTPAFTGDHNIGAAYISFVLLGAGVLAPWNAFITAVDYFAEVYPGGHMDRKITVCYMPAMLITMLVVIRFHTMLSSRLRMIVGFAGFTVLLMAVPVVDALFVKESSAPPIAQALTLAAVCGTGILDGLAQGAVLGDAAYLPAKYQQAFASGTAVSGVLISLLRIFTKLGFGDSWLGLRRSTMLYFIAALAVTSLCLFLAAYVVPRLPTVLYYRDLARLRAYGSGVLPEQLKLGGELDVASYDEDDEESSMSSMEGSHKRAVGTKLASMEETATVIALAERGQKMAHGAQVNSADEEDDSAALVQGSRKKTDYLQLAYKMRHHLIGLVTVYTVTLTIFPGVVAEDVHSGSLGDWYNVLLVTAFNFADLAGKTLPAFTPVIRARRKFVAWSGARVVFLPLFYAAVMIFPDGHPGVMTLLVVVLGLSNGFVTTNAFMEAPRGLQGQEVDLAGSLLVLALSIGLLIGAGGGWLWLLVESV